MAKYQIKITTGNLPDACTNADVKIRIGGSEASIDDAELIQLDRILIDDFERHQTDTFKIEYIDVGEIEFIGLLLEPRNMLCVDEWYVETIQIGKMVESDEDENNSDKSEEDESEENDSEKDKIDHESAIVWHEFPIYSWILPRDEVQYFFTNKTSIPQKDSTTRQDNEYRDQRILKNHINWTKSEQLPGFPGHIETECGKPLHHCLRFTDRKDRDFLSNGRTAKRNYAFTQARNLFKEFYELEHYKKAAQRLWECSLETMLGKNVDAPPPYFANDHWQKDEEFGRQILNGMNPSWIQRVKDGLPENFPVTNDVVGDLLTRELTLDEEIEQGNIYLINHDILTGISTGNHSSKGSYTGAKLELAVPLCLFYVGDDEKLRPIAIQLGQEPDDFPIWTPKDGEWAWLLAKIWFRNADFQVHQMTSHLAYTHLLIEPIAIATFMCLPPQHPVYKLLRWHIQFVIAINTIGRARIVSEVKIFPLNFVSTPQINDVGRMIMDILLPIFLIGWHSR